MKRVNALILTHLIESAPAFFITGKYENEKPIPFVEQVLYRDEHILVADKPHFLPVIPVGKISPPNATCKTAKKPRHESLVPVHRLDRETAGVILFSVNPKTRGHYTSLFRNRKVRKEYEALAPTLDQLNYSHNSAESHRAWRTILSHEGSSRQSQILKLTSIRYAIWDRNTLYQLVPVTGRKHQLRLHLAALGIPIINDKLYPAYDVLQMTMIFPVL